MWRLARLWIRFQVTWRHAGRGKIDARPLVACGASARCRGLKTSRTRGCYARGQTVRGVFRSGWMAFLLKYSPKCTWLTDWYRLVKSLLGQICYSLDIVMLWRSVEYCQVVIPMIAIVINRHIDIDLVSLIKRPYRRDTMNDALVDRNTHRLGEIHEPNGCRVRSLFNNRIKHISIDLFLCQRLSLFPFLHDELLCCV